MPHTRFYVYILSNRTRVLYVGRTSDLIRRMHQHRNGLIQGFTRRYNVTHLVHFEQTDSARISIQRERQLKGWRRARKIQLIEVGNPEWKDLAEEWFQPRSL